MFSRRIRAYARALSRGVSSLAVGPIRNIGLLDPHIVQIWIGDDRFGIVTIQGIVETFEVVADAKTERSVGEIMTDYKLIEMRCQRFWRKDRGKACLT